VPANTQFLRYNAHVRPPQSFRFFTCGETQTPLCIQLQLRTETLHQRISDGREAFDERPSTLKMCRSPWLDVLMCALIPVEDILSILCELCFDKWKELDICYILNMYIKFK